ncbi:methylated-DNA--protein-cysteine methyltransferase isoform X4 [Gadus chalcogrammus]|uniref:methylated-DNA--protein-cysteine methyltransferase isoform X4 n=1 Tax=Gadus chalcogrammus TaxID=1042646 RepID=UPI0024C4D4B0|nr:methylated-DNA--protein-cysteine methyltransferase isoform X4 [Gadus chalcogrammus]
MRRKALAMDEEAKPKLFRTGREMKRRRGGEGESQCTQKTISLQSPLGTIQVRGCEAGVHTIRLLMDVAPAERNDQGPGSCEVIDGSAGAGPELLRCVDWLRDYFSDPGAPGGPLLPRLHHPTLRGDSFSSRVLRTLLQEVRFGETVSYKRLAEMAGNPRAVRAVGGAMRRNPALSCPRMHRSAAPACLSPCPGNQNQRLGDRAGS